MSRALLSAVLSSRLEHSSRFPTPGHPSSFRNRTGQFSKASPRDVALLRGRGMAALCQREARESVSLGILTSPPFLVALTHPGSCWGIKGDVAM